MPQASEVGNFQNLIANLAGLAVAKVGQLLAATQDDPKTLQDAYPPTVDPYIAAGATLSAEWYSSLAPDKPFVVEPAPPPPVDALKTNVRWALTQPDTVLALAGSAERHIFTATRDTVTQNAVREKVRFARYASANACPWCRVLATRGAAYHTAEGAVKGHDNCHCIAVPIRGGDTYSPPDYVKQWEQDYNAARSEVGGNLDDIVNYLRRTSPNRG